MLHCALTLFMGRSDPRAPPRPPVKSVSMQGCEHPVKQLSILRYRFWYRKVPKITLNHFNNITAFAAAVGCCFPVELAEWDIPGQSAAGQEKTQRSSQKRDVESGTLD